MKEKLASLQKRQAELVAKMEGHVNKNEVTSEDEAEFTKASTELDAVKAEIRKVEAVLAEKQRLADERKQNAMVTEPVKAADDILKMPAEPRSLGHLRVFKGHDGIKRAETAAKWLAAVNGNASAQKWCNERGIAMNYQATGQNATSNSAGGYLVPDILLGDIIDLLKDYGVFRQNCQIVPMSTDTVRIPRKTGGLTAYFVGETDAATASTAGWGQVTLSAKDIAVLAYASNNLINDAVINVVDDLMMEIARAIAYMEDKAGFYGDSSSTYGGITGAVNAISSAAFGVTGPVATTYGGGIIASGNTMAEVTIGDLLKVIGVCPVKARANAKWFTSPLVFSAVLQRLALAQGGATATEMVNGVNQPKILGYPVVLSEVFPSSDANSQCLLLFGDLRLAAKMGDRQQLTFATSTEATVGSTSMFTTRQTAILANERVDIVVHDVGTTSEAGPIVSLWSLNS